MSNNTVPLTCYDDQENLCDTFHLIHSQCTKNFEDLQTRDIFYIWNNTSHLGSHRVLPTGRRPSKIPETFELELLDFQPVLSAERNRIGRKQGENEMLGRKREMSIRR